MCSIPGLPTPESEVSVLITRVNLQSSHRLVELWVNMEDGRKQIHEQRNEEILIPQEKFCGSEGKPGDLCLVCISDTWHRARIVSLQSETYHLFLIDQGQPHVTTSEALAWGKSDSFLLPPKIESCILANIISLQNEWPETVTKFLMCLPGKKFKGLVQHVIMPDRIILLEIPIISKHMCKLGAAKKIKVEEFKELVQKRLHAVAEDSSDLTQELNPDVSCQPAQHDQYFYPELTTDIFEMVNVTAVVDPLNISCMLHIFSKAVKVLSEQIHQQYEERSDFGARPQSCGDPCAARGTDGRWHRALLKQNITTSKDAVEVLHVDEGKAELVKADDIRPLSHKFLKMPVVTYFCSLSGVKETSRKWSADETEDLKSMLLNQTAVVRFDGYNKSQDVYYVTLYTGNDECVNNIFFEKSGLTSSSESEQDLNLQLERIPLPIPFVEKEINLHYKNKVADDLQGKMYPKRKKQVGDSSADESSTSGINNIHVERSFKVPDPEFHYNKHLSTSLQSEAQHGGDENMFAAEKTIDVKISCIESLQRFWCQATDHSVSLRRLMEDLQNHYASAFPQPLVQSTCVARNPGNKMWYRARIIVSHDSPTVHVRFIDYGQTQKVPLRDLHPIHPTFSQLEAQAFQCCLLDLNNPTDHIPIDLTDSALSELLKFVDLGTGLKCVVKAVTSSEDGLLLNMVDIQTESESLCKLLTQKCVQSKAEEQIPPEVPLDGYVYSTHNIELGVEEKVLVTYSETVSHFYCQLDRNSHVLEQLMKNVVKLLEQQQISDHPLKLNRMCLARYTDNQWYRGQIVEVSPKLKVHFVDYGDTLTVLDKEIHPFPPEASIVRSVPVQAIPLGLFDIPADLPLEVNQWFADLTVGHSFTISVVAKGEKRKLIVELFDGSLKVNVMVREKVEKMNHQLLSNQCTADLPNEDSSTQKPRTTQQEEARSSYSQNDSSPQMEQRISDDSKPSLDVVTQKKETEAETFIQSSHLEITQRSSDSSPGENGKISFSYKWPNISDTTVEVYASCIVGPNYFWCQYANTEDLNTVSKLAEEAGQTHVFSSEILEPGTPCLALFLSDNMWYRAQIIQKESKSLRVLFIDYGNESEVDIHDVRPLPHCLLEIPPQAFLCCLNDFESTGCWDDEVYDEFYNLLVNKPLTLTVVGHEHYSEIAVPQYSVIAECDQVVVNKLMQKYWKSFSIEPPVNDVAHIETSPRSIQTESIITNVNASREETNTFKYKEPEISKCETETVFASCVTDPGFFWCQFNTENLDRVSQLAQEAGEAEQDIMFPQSLGPGSPCLTLLPSDNQWYRAKIVCKGDETLTVLFVDYGNEAEVDMKDVRPLPRSLLETTTQAFLCCLSGFDESKGSWDDKAYDEFYNLLDNKPLRLNIRSVEKHSQITVPHYSVEIEQDGVDINAAMLKYWKPVTEECRMTKNPQTINLIQDDQTQSVPKCLSMPNKTFNRMSMFKDTMRFNSKTEMVFASCIAEPNFFWCQFANTEDLNRISQLVQEAEQAEQDTIPQNLDPGSPCLAWFSQDNQWYRAQILWQDENLHVLFVDYGNEADVDMKNVKLLPESLLEPAPQAFLCCLDGFDESEGSWDDEAYDDFYNLLVDKPLKLTVLNMKHHAEIAVPQFSVEIEHEGVKINAAMLKYWKPVTEECRIKENLQGRAAQPETSHNKTDVFKHTMLCRSSSEMVFASCIAEPNFFWCQFANTEDLDKVCQLAQEAGQKDQDMMIPQSLDSGDVCLALFSQDNQWHRAQIVQKDEEILHVLFVDYGNEAEVDVKNVRPLPRSLLETTTQAFLCCLSGFDESKGSWDDKAYDKFYNLLVDKPLKLNVFNMEGHSETGGPRYGVEIECEGVIVNTLMEKYWKPLDTVGALAKSLEPVDETQTVSDV